MLGGENGGYLLHNEKVFEFHGEYGETRIIRYYYNIRNKSYS